MVAVPRALLNIGMKLISFPVNRRNFRPEDELGIEDYIICECEHCDNLVECEVNGRYLSCSTCTLEFMEKDKGLVRKITYPVLRRMREQVEYAEDQGLGRGTGLSTETEDQEE